MVSVSKEHLETVYKEVETYSFNPLELQVQGLYTHNLFTKFQMEMKVKTGYRCDSCKMGHSRLAQSEESYQNMGIGTTMCKQTRMKVHIHALAASLSVMVYSAHMCYE